RLAESGILRLIHSRRGPRAAAVALQIGIASLAACAAMATSPSIESVGAAAQTSLSLRSSDWDTISNPPAFALRNDAAGALVFDFPDSGSINYLYNLHPSCAIAGTLSLSLQITTAGSVLFNYTTDPANTCATPASVRPFIWANRNGDGDFDRWWSN